MIMPRPRRKPRTFSAKKSSLFTAWRASLHGKPPSVSIFIIKCPLRMRRNTSNNFLICNSDKAHLAELEAGRVPKAWKPKGPSTLEEVTLLAPLEIVSARGRAKKVFDFDYVWEVYKPLHQRKWGYYTLPILYGDDLVARLDPKLDRATNTLHILGFWLEDDAPKDSAFADALAEGLKRFADMIGAENIDLGGVKRATLRMDLKTRLKRLGF
ncbi:MAG: hypothetical protein DYG86_10610 [Chloroflexi bacterium CFX2]|nr:hypothetical protein [Chloroflexi bacterium CFX2]